MIRVRNVVDSVAFYPLTTLYIGSCGALISVSSGMLSMVQGVGSLGLLTALAMLASTRHELRRIHAIVNASHAALRARNAELEQLLDASNRQWALLMETVRAMDAQR